MASTGSQRLAASMQGEKSATFPAGNLILVHAYLLYTFAYSLQRMHEDIIATHCRSSMVILVKSRGVRTCELLHVGERAMYFILACSFSTGSLRDTAVAIVLLVASTLAAKE